MRTYLNPISIPVVAAMIPVGMTKITARKIPKNTTPTLVCQYGLLEFVIMIPALRIAPAETHKGGPPSNGRNS